ncbi:MAG TPA: hypothetical protein VE007_07845 [Thermoanaerobaculia bacterium]|nr:hypothetical protein [Thermoanaerobaculia bacterium]
MKKLLAVARREVIEKKFVFAAALAVSAIVPLLPVLRGMTGAGARDLRGFLAVFASWSFVAAVAAALGASALAGEIARGHGGFYFSRPLSSVSIWGGKLASSLGIALAAGLIVAAPALLIDRRLDPLADLAGSTGRGLLVAAAAAVLLFLASHAIATMVRSRSMLALGDLLLAVAVGFLTWDALRRLYELWPDPARGLWRVGAAGAVVVAAVLVAGMHRGVSRGRTDPRAAHRGLSVTVWSGLLVAALVLTIYSRWVLAAPPSSLESFESASPLGSDGWVSLEGLARGTRAEFLYDTRTGRSRRIFGPPAVSADGSTAAWAERESGRSSPWVVRTMRLDRHDVSPTETRLSLRSPWRIFLSDDGSRIGSIEDGLLSISELPSGRSLASARLGQASTFAAGVFAAKDLVRVYTGTAVHPERVEIFELHIDSRDLARTGSAASPRAWFLGSPSHDRFVQAEKDPGRWTLRDGRTGEVIATLREGGPLFSAASARMSDGRWVLLLSDETESWLEVFSPSGERLSRLRIGQKGIVLPGGEVAQGKLALALAPGKTSPPGDPARKLYVADIERRTVERRADGLRPIWFLKAGGIRPGSEATKLFLDDSKTLVRFDTATGERRIVLGGS